jgi:lipoprotein-releasing system ATP-binding protein
MQGLQVDRVAKTFDTGASRVEVLRDVTFTAAPGESVAILGPSGSGKSTLLHLVGALDQPSEGRVAIDGRATRDLGERDLARFRNETIGFVFQDHHLLPQFSVLENVLIPTMAFPSAGSGDANPEASAGELLDRVGLSHRLTHRPAELSGGEKQRVAVARALINRPKLMLCDEPTGSLDGRTADQVADLLFELHREADNLLIIVTHSPDLAARCARRLRLADGSCSEA